MPDTMKQWLTAADLEAALQDTPLNDDNSYVLLTAVASDASTSQHESWRRAENEAVPPQNYHLKRPEPHLVNVGPGRFEQLLRESKGKPFVFDDGDMRSLHFEAKYVQSAMWLSAPDELALSYTRAMMGFLLFKPAPHHILMVGLGGGSLAKYCYRYLPSARITVVEINADVIALRDKFMIPPDDERFQVIHIDAADYIARIDQNVDVLLLDGFKASGQPAELRSAHFYAMCRRRLNRNGVLVANLSGDDPDFTLLMTRLHAEFGCQMWWGQAIDSNNGIVFARKSKRDSTFHPPLIKRAMQLDQRFKLELPQLAARLQTTAADGKSPAQCQPSHRGDDPVVAKLDRLARAVADLLTIIHAQEST